jgi:hypothetical protein
MRWRLVSLASGANAKQSWQLAVAEKCVELWDHVDENSTISQIWIAKARPRELRREEGREAADGAAIVHEMESLRRADTNTHSQ